jgi:hypothetical protein
MAFLIHVVTFVALVVLVTLMTLVTLVVLVALVRVGRRRLSWVGWGWLRRSACITLHAMAAVAWAAGDVAVSLDPHLVWRGSGCGGLIGKYGPVLHGGYGGVRVRHCRRRTGGLCVDQQRRASGCQQQQTEAIHDVLSKRE